MSYLDDYSKYMGKHVLNHQPGDYLWPGSKSRRNVSDVSDELVVRVISMDPKKMRWSSQAITSLVWFDSTCLHSPSGKHGGANSCHFLHFHVTLGKIIEMARLSCPDLLIYCLPGGASPVHGKNLGWYIFELMFSEPILNAESWGTQ